MVHIAFQDIQGAIFIEPFQSLSYSKTDTTAVATINGRIVSNVTADLAGDMLREDSPCCVAQVTEGFHVLDICSYVIEVEIEEGKKKADATVTSHVVNPSIPPCHVTTDIMEFNSRYPVGTQFLYHEPSLAPVSRAVPVITVSEAWLTPAKNRYVLIKNSVGNEYKGVLEGLLETSPAA